MGPILFQKRKKYSFCIEYRLGGVCRSNQSTWSWQRNYVKEGTFVKAGDFLAEGRSSVHNQLAVGQNLLIGYIPWDGLNFEDAMVASESLVTKETFTSTHIEEWETSLKRIPLGKEVFVPFSLSLFSRMNGWQNNYWIESLSDSRESFSCVVGNNSVQTFSKKKNCLWLEKKEVSFFLGK